jgi:guanylate kinase
VISQKRLGLVYVLVGPGGVGKNTLMKHAIATADNLRQLPTATTRKIRDGEQHGREHLFLQPTEFERMIAQNELLEWQEVHPGKYYGVPRASIETPLQQTHDLIADIEIAGAAILRATYPDNVVLIFIAPPGQSPEAVLALLRARMTERGENEEEITKRLDRAQMELMFAPECDYLIINDELSQAAEMLVSVIRAERARRALANLRAQYHLPRQPISYTVLVTPVYQDEALLPDHGQKPLHGRLFQGELPHQGAARLLKTQLQIEIDSVQFRALSQNGDGYVAPLGVGYQHTAHADEVVFEYVYTLPERITPPQGWMWGAREQMPTMRTEMLRS